MFRYFNDISIRGKLIFIVTGTVTLLTVCMLISVLFTARNHVDSAVHDELRTTGTVYLRSEGAHMRVHVLEAKELANSAALLPVFKDKAVACKLAESVLNDKNTKLDLNDSFDLAAVMLPDNTPFALAVRGKAACNTGSLQWQLPAIVDRSRSEVINWDAPDDTLYQLVETPILDKDDRDLGTMVLAFAIKDSWAAHIKARSGIEAGIALWHMDGDKVHLVATSTNHLREILTPRMQQGPLRQEEILNNDYDVLDTPVLYQSDIVYNSQGLHMAVVQSRLKKMQPFIYLRNELLGAAALALILGLIIGVLISHPIASPLRSLADAAESVAQGNLDIAQHLMNNHPGRLHSKDEIGVLGRAFLAMVQGLKEKMAMSTFLSHSTYEHIHSNAEEGKEDDGGDESQRKTLTVLFSDVRKFSNFSETKEPEVVIQLLNQVLSIEAQVVAKNGGDIDKFVGDAVVAWFSGEDRCLRAVRAANEMIAALNAKFGGQPGTTIGVGIHVGEVVVGSIGSSTRRDYTAIGSNVNLAARLCSNAHPGQVLISKAVAQELHGEASVKPLDPIPLKGFSEPVPVFDASTNQAIGTSAIPSS